MNNCCVNLRIRSKKYKKYLYCNSAKQTITFESCKDCPFKKYHKPKKIQEKIVKNSIMPVIGAVYDGITGVAITYINFEKPGYHKHHIFNGNGLRNLSEKFGLYVWVKWDDHVLDSNSLHENPRLMLALKRKGQKQFQQHFPNLDFKKYFGKNYL